MRQVLLRIRLDDLFSLEPIENVTAIGVGYLLVLWIALGLWVVIQRLRQQFPWSQNPADAVWTISIGVLVPAVILTVPSRFGVTSVPVFGYGCMLVVAFLAAIRTATWRLRFEGLGSEFVWDLAMWLFFSGILGARLFYVIQYRDEVFAGKQGLGYLWAAINLPDGGLTLFGGLILASVATIVFLYRYCHQHNQNPLYVADILVPSVFLGIACGRIGCFLNGCCYGDRCNLFWAVRFPKDSVPYRALQWRGLLPSDALASLPLHPTQIYSTLNALVLAALTAAYFKHRTRNGAVVALALVTYPISRFVIEILRWDESAKWGTGLTISQLVSLFVLGIGLAMAGWCFLSDRSNLQRREHSASKDVHAAA